MAQNLHTTICPNLFIKAIIYRPDIVRFVLDSAECGYQLLNEDTDHEIISHQDRSSNVYSGTALHAACRYNLKSFKLMLNSKWCTSELVETVSDYSQYTDYYSVTRSGTVLHLALIENISAAFYLINTYFNIKKLLKYSMTSLYDDNFNCELTSYSCFELAASSRNKYLMHAVLDLD